MRSKTTIWGAFISVMLSVMVLTCIIGVRGGLTDTMETMLKSAGQRFYVVSFALNSAGGGLTRTEAERLLDLLAGLDSVQDVACKRVAAVDISATIIAKGDRRSSVPVYVFSPVTENYLEVRGEKPVEGRWFTREEIEKGADVCTVSRRIAAETGVSVGDKLFPLLRFEIKGVPPAELRVVGIEEGNDIEVHIPWNHPWAYRTLSAATDVWFFVRPKIGLMEESMAECEDALRELENLPEWRVKVPPERTVAYVKVVRSYLRSFLWIAVIGVGVANLNVGGVLLALAEATRRERGVKRALGQSRLNSVTELVGRGFSLTLAGSATGVVLGYFLAPHAAQLIGEQSVVTPTVVLLCLAVTAIVCLGATIIPSVVAVRTDPVEAIRGEASSRRGFLDMHAGSVIAVMGVVVAVVSMVVIQGLGRATEINADRLIELGGRNGLVIQGYDPFERARLGVEAEYPTPEDFARVQQLQGELGFKSAYLITSVVNVASGREVAGLAVTGVMGDALSVKGLRTKWGLSEVGPGKCVLGYETAKRLFGNPAKAVGQRLTIGEDVQCIVAGVLEPVPRGMVSKVVEPDDTLYMPYEEAIGARGFDVSPKGAEIFLRFESEEALKNGKDEIVSLLPVENDVPVYAVTEPLRSLEEYKNFRAKSGRVFSLFASIALVGSGIGLFNYMVVEVLNRRKEIGVLRAVGASKTEIAKDVLREGLFVTGAGGVTAFAISAALLVLMGNPLPVVEWMRLFCLALAISGVLGILSGLAPAIMASNQDPVECLRME
ncbi:MAG: ABC transporter permease [Firmicutes bacterium]|nr:ABC transporter permease [Candidatus Fermentithermobacillaceae bacterium]